ncbi:hypothetical protein ABPG74_008086 [Tetrahymena malaccensis]
MADNKLTLGYWGGFGKAQPARYLLELTKTPYNDMKYFEDGKWFKQDKLSLGLDFPNLPYLIDGEVKLTEFVAIFDYLSEKYGKPEWLGKGNDKYVVSSLRSLFDELSTQTHRGSLKKTQEEKKQYILDNFVPKFRYLSKFIGRKEYLLGYFTIADLYFLSVINEFKANVPQDSYTEFAPVFDPIINRIASIPEIAGYIASESHPKQ